ncbi:hypothetical protein DXT99_05025 [Pontibacter diazotrophicus]|uniref:Uncharacterized protein n=1 Tax=Pontibacter diazotrophicus TaxID=1400979 RepID=A0A3D8LGP7_9BACT|nr:hypothetical protein DXT99_05025 [Pontibacter diazotrophicus]
MSVIAEEIAESAIAVAIGIFGIISGQAFVGELLIKFEQFSSPIMKTSTAINYIHKANVRSQN